MLTVELPFVLAVLLLVSVADWQPAAVERLRERGRAVYAYFSNFYEGHAPASANKLKRLLGETIVGPEELENQPSLF